MSVEKINVAVVDDDISVRRALERLLRAGGFEPVIYDSAEAFLEDARQMRADCLLLDIHLGGMSGLDLQQMLAEAGTVPPIIFITAHDEAETREVAQRAGYAAYFRKPFPGSSLLEAIRQAVGTGPSDEGQGEK
jgi:FixJ family two-component response regulator